MTKTKILPATATLIGTETEVGVLANKAKSDPAQMRKVIGVDDYGSCNVSRMQGGHGVIPIATERWSRLCDEPSGIRNENKKKRCDTNIERERPGG